jgi:hypothetical protein
MCWPAQALIDVTAPPGARLESEMLLEAVTERFGLAAHWCSLESTGCLPRRSNVEWHRQVTHNDLCGQNIVPDGPRADWNDQGRALAHEQPGWGAEYTRVVSSARSNTASEWVASSAADAEDSTQHRKHPVPNRPEDSHMWRSSPKCYTRAFAVFKRHIPADGSGLGIHYDGCSWYTFLFAL